jgi:hypothetical protein
MENSNVDDASNAYPKAASSRRPSKLRNIALGVGLGGVIAIAGILALLALSRHESLPPITLDDVNAAAARWADHGPADYEMDLQQSGINPGLIHVEVRRSQVTAMTLNGHPTRPHLWDDWSVPGILAVFHRDVEVCMPDLNAKAQQRVAADAQNPDASAPPILPRGLFDPHDGHPTQYHRITPTGADANWRVISFAPR